MSWPVLDLEEFVSDFADALLAVDKRGEQHKAFLPGIGPFGEAQAVALALAELKSKDVRYGDAAVKRSPDLLIPRQWAIELKVIRPFGDNGRPAEHWSENVLHPYAGNTSALGDCLKLLVSHRPERKAVIVFGFEHAPAQVDLSVAMSSFELIAERVMHLRLAPRIEACRTGLRHPVHQVLRVFGYEVIEALT